MRNSIETILHDMERKKSEYKYITLCSIDELNECIDEFPFYNFYVISNPIIGQVKTDKAFLVVHVVRKVA